MRATARRRLAGRSISLMRVQASLFLDSVLSRHPLWDSIVVWTGSPLEDFGEIQPW